MNLPVGFECEFSCKSELSCSSSCGNCCNNADWGNGLLRRLLVSLNAPNKGSILFSAEKR